MPVPFFNKPRVWPVLGAALSLLAMHALADEFGAQRTDLSEKDLRRVEKVVAWPTDFSLPEPFEMRSGGAATSTRIFGREAFSQFSANLDFDGQQRFKLGNALFRKLWVGAPASTRASDGLGPLFNSRSCQSCHLKDGRGHPPVSADDDRISMFLRLSVPPRTEAERAAIASGMVMFVPDPIYGGQLQDLAIPGHKGEGRLEVTYETRTVSYADGTTLALRVPRYAIADPAYGALDPGLMVSARIAPQMIGMGLLEAIEDADIIANADPDDENGDGISGRISRIVGESGEVRLGRFGWKASAPSVREQSAGAFGADMGLSTSLVPQVWGDCTVEQIACRQAPDGVQADLGSAEVPDPVLDLVVFYSQNLAVPARRNVGGAKVLAGKAHFYGLGCAQCHTPKYVTSRNAENAAHRFQLIWPFTDLLLHDMGEGLADNRPVGSASGREWRTPPLWGVGLTREVSGHTQFLHDGRARSLEEAIVWHGGEAEPARNGFMALSAQERAELIAFLESL